MKEKRLPGPVMDLVEPLLLHAVMLLGSMIDGTQHS